MHGLYHGVVTCAMGVRLAQVNGDPIRPAGMRILAAADAFAKMFDQPVLITCGTEGHKTGKHPRGEAFDFRSKSYEPEVVLKFYAWMRNYLGTDFTVLYEVPRLTRGVPTVLRDPALEHIVYWSDSATAEHFHVQVRKDIQVWPAVAAGSVTVA